MIEDFELNPLIDPRFIKPYFATYTQDGINKDWEVLEANDSVAILIYHKEHDSFVLVKQFRPAVYLNNHDGMTVELCAGLVDKNLSLEQIAKEEILEECGFDVPVDNIEKITSFHTSVGFAGSMQTLYYAQVDESMRINDGGGIDDEQIEVIELPVSEANDFIFDESIAKTPGLMFAFYWFSSQYLSNTHP
jgi:UDP-sugar diphosphatase